MSDDDKGSFWTTIPGMLTGLAAIITAIGGLLLALSQADLLGNRQIESLRTGTENASNASGETPPNVPISEDSSPSLSDSLDTGTGEIIDTEDPGNLTPTQSTVDSINLLSQENGGHIVIASSETWIKSIDGEENSFSTKLNTQAVYAFKDTKSATFDSFRVLIPRAYGYNLNEFQLLAGNDFPIGEFQLIGTFNTQNIRVFDNPYQEFNFEPVKAKYLKVVVLSQHNNDRVPISIHEFQLFGRLDES